MISNYYVVSYNAEGKSNLLDSNLKGLENLIVIECCSRLITTMIFKKISNEILSKSQDLEIIHNPIDNNIIEGIIDRNLKIGIFSKCLIEGIDTEHLNKDYLSLNYCYSNTSDEINNIKNDIKNKIDKAVEFFKKAKKTHDDWEKVYIESFDFSKADEIIETKTNEILKDISFDKESIIRERFFGAISAKGAVNYVEEIIENKKTRYFIKGRPGTSKSTLLKTLAHRASERGIDVDVYYCASDINSLDMLVFPELEICIFDSTAPHEFFPSEDRDILLDMYAELLEEGFDEKNENVLNKIKFSYKEDIDEGVSLLSEVLTLYDTLETEYISTIDFDLLAKLYDKIIEIIK